MANSNVIRNTTLEWRMLNRNVLFEERTKDLVNVKLYVANVGDLIFEPPYMFYTVSSVDSVTNFPTLERINPSMGMSVSSGDEDSIGDGLKVYQPHISQRIFVNATYDPAECEVDSRVRIYNRNAVVAKFFRGSDVFGEAEVISQNVNANGVTVDETVALYSVFPDNDTVKRPAAFHTKVPLTDGETVTMVAYNSSDTAVDIRPFKVVNTQNIIGTTSSNLYVEDIQLMSSLISKDDSELIEVPLGTPLDSSLFTCRIHYSYGKYKDIGLDGVNAKLLNLNAFNFMDMTEHEVVLVYKLSDQEQAINVQGATPHIPRVYRIVARRASANDNVFRVWLVPHFRNGMWTLSFYLTDLEYSLFEDITADVEVKQENGEDFNPMLFGQRQRLNISILLDSVVYQAYPDFTHTQTTDLILYNPDTVVDGTFWEIDYIVGAQGYYGDKAIALASMLDDKAFTIDGGYRSEYDWLTAFYSTLDPIYDTQALDTVPYPTHFRLKHAEVTVGTFKVSEFNSRFELGYDNDWVGGEPLIVEWVFITQSNEYVLAVSPFTVKYH